MQMTAKAAYDDEGSFLPSAGGARATESLFLVQELTHRFNNDLAALAGFVSLTAAQYLEEEAKLAMAGILQRIFDLAAIQQALRVPQDRSVDCAGYLAELCRSISAAKLQYRNIELEFVDCPLTLNSFECWRVGMIVAELVNNAARHAFCDRGGRIQVAMTHRDCSVEFTVADNGRGRDNFCEGQGTAIVRHLAGLLESAIDYRSTPSGTIARLTLPVSKGQIAANAIPAGPQLGCRVLQDGSSESESTKSFAATAPSFGGRTSATL